MTCPRTSSRDPSRAATMQNLRDALKSRRLRSLAAFLLLALASPTMESCACAPPPCEDDDACANGDVCRDGVCAAAIPCTADACASNQLCADDDGDANCLSGCVAGFDWNGSACVASPDGCDLCAAEYRACNDITTGECGDCLGGFEEDAALSCVPVANCDPAPAASSILDACTDENRVCVAVVDGASCGGCALNHVDVDGACVPFTACDDDLADACATLNRTCVEDPNGACGDCVDGFVAELDGDGAIVSCRVPLVCADITCATLCNEGGPGQDAFCTEACVGSGGNPGVENAAGECVECASCDGEGEDGPYLTSLYAGNRCVCKSAPGHYYDPAVNDTQPCDADGDGWTRMSAKLSAASSDPAVQATFQCALHTISAFVLDQEPNGAAPFQTLTVPQSPPLTLYESDRRDNQVLLDLDNLYAVGSRQLAANELNSLAKVCNGAGSRADYNGNGIADVDESHGMSVGDANLQPYVDFAFFTELYSGSYEPPTSGTGPGTYRIAERSRDVDAIGGVPLQIDDDVDVDDAGVSTITNAYWRQCTRFVDDGHAAVLGDGIDAVGFDFARFDASDDYALTHHSQFKCLRVVGTTTPTSPRHLVTPAALVNDPVYALNACDAVGTTTPTVSPNPNEAAFACAASVQPSTVAVGDVLWGVVKYVDYDGNNYRFGCVNECAEFKDRCPGFNAASPNNTQCVGTVSNFGELACGCDVFFGGTSCDAPCVGPDPRTSSTTGTVSNLFLSDDYDVAPRQGIWLCGAPSVTEASTLSSSFDDAGVPSGWTLRGEVPSTQTPGVELCSNTDGGSCGVAISAYSVNDVVLTPDSATTDGGN